ncbi:MAG: helix-turn-helix domain-containing protein [Eubacterium sp.]
MSTDNKEFNESTESPREILRKNLINLRNSNNLKQKNIADTLGLERSTYTSWEKGRSSPKPNEIVKLAKIYNVTTDYLLTGKSNDTMQVASISEYDRGVYGDSNVSELTDFEKTLLLKIRVLNTKDKQKLADFLEQFNI